MEDGQIREANKVCGVCGDRALGYNFNAVSCESCKAFFRRNALKNKVHLSLQDFRCPFTENCNITPVTRRFCQKCRLDKCLSIGMRKEYIMSEEDKVLKRNKVEQNRAKKRPSPDISKIAKTKKESLNDTIFDDTSTSLPSATSVTSIVSETYFWESDKNVHDVSKQLTIDHSSPITASSVPSPSSPPENCDIAGTKTLEMLKDATFIKNDHSVSFDLNELHSDNNPSSQINFNHSYNQDTRLPAEPIKILNSVLNNSMENRSQDQVNTSLASSICTRYQNLSPNYSTFNSTNNKKKEHESMCQTSWEGMENCIDQATLMLSQSKVEDGLVNKKCEATSSNTELISKLVKNPNIFVKVFQDPTFLEKFISDLDVMKKLVSNPCISQILETNIKLSDLEDAKNIPNEKIDVNVGSKQLVHDNLISINYEENLQSTNQNHLLNPILTNLITNKNSEEEAKHSKDPCKVEKLFKTDVPENILKDVQKIPITANSVESILCEAIKLEYSAYSCSPLGNQNSRELNDTERAKLNELIVAHKALLAPLDEDISNLVSEDCKVKANPGETDPILLGVINLTAVAIRRLIKMSKKISAFKNMCQEDQLALLKGGCTEMMMLRSALNYDPEKEIWKIPHSQDKVADIKVEVLKEAKGNLYDEHSKFVRTFDSRWRDENIILILSAIALFSPKRPRVIHKDVIKLEQNSYYYLLRRYLESIYPGCEAKSTFLKLIKKMSELQKLNEEIVGVYLNVNPSSVEPLLIEIFDLKH